MTELRIVFAGTPAFGLPCLDAIANSPHQLAAVYTQPDRPAGRGRQLQASAVKQWAEAQQVPIYQPTNFKDVTDIKTLAALEADVMVVIAYGLLLPQTVLSIPKAGCINVHASLLPKWRGASPIQHAILHGDQESGVTIMQMDIGMDTGAMLTSARCPIHAHDTAQILHDRLSALAVAPLMTCLQAIASNQPLPATPQNHAHATYAPKIKKEDAHICWQNPASQIDHAIRAFFPSPIAYTLAGTEVLRIHQARPVVNTPHAVPGTILSIDKAGILVATGHECLLIESLQFPGSKKLSVADWLNAHRKPLYTGFVFT